jgi:hypothetical protein
MPKRVSIAPHLSLDELEQGYRQPKDPIQWSHYQARGKSTQDVAEGTGYSCSWIYELVWGYNRDGADSLGDGRRHSPGAMPLLDAQQQVNLLVVLRGPSPDGGCGMVEK